MSHEAQQLAASKAKAIDGKLNHSARFPDWAFNSRNFKEVKSLLDEDANRGLADIAAGRTQEADAAFAQIQQRRKDSGKPS